MQRLEVSGAVRPLQLSLGVKGLILLLQILNKPSLKLLDINSKFRVVVMFAPAGSHVTNYVTELPSHQHSYTWLWRSVGFGHQTGNLIRNSHGRHVAISIQQTRPLNKSCTFPKVPVTHISSEPQIKGRYRQHGLKSCKPTISIFLSTGK